jgi:hypothetical protein
VLRRAGRGRVCHEPQWYKCKLSITLALPEMDGGLRPVDGSNEPGEPISQAHFPSLFTQHILNCQARLRDGRVIVLPQKGR